MTLRRASFRIPPSYVYGAPYLNAGAASTGLVPLQATQLSHAAAIAAATNQFYEYQNAVATAAAAQYPNQYTAAAGYDAYSYSPGTAAAVAGKVSLDLLSESPFLTLSVALFHLLLKLMQQPAATSRTRTLPCRKTGRAQRAPTLA